MDWKKTLGAVVPGVATMLGGPLAGMASSALLNFFGIESTGDSTKDDELIGQAVAKMTPEQAIELKKIEADLKIKLQQAEIDIFKIESDDRDSARQREMQLKDWVPGLLAGGLTVGFFGTLSAMIWGPSEALAANQAFNIMLGSLGTGWSTMLAYYYGSSKGSYNKDITIASMSKTSFK